MLFKNCQTSEKLLSAKQCKITTAIWNYEITENVLHIIELFSQNRRRRRKLYDYQAFLMKRKVKKNKFLNT